MREAHIIGYWNGPDENRFIDPQILVINWASKILAQAIHYLNSGEPHATYKGYSRCRFCGCHNGSIERTDGMWIWPEGLSHYLDAHDISLPRDFIDHMRQNDFKVPALQGSVKGSLDLWLRFCEIERENYKHSITYVADR